MERDDNLFLALGKYKYNLYKRRNTDEIYLNEQENYFTEAFTLLLNKNKDSLAVDILKFIDKR